MMSCKIVNFYYLFTISLCLTLPPHPPHPLSPPCPTPPTPPHPPTKQGRGAPCCPPSSPPPPPTPTPLLRAHSTRPPNPSLPPKLLQEVVVKMIEGAGLLEMLLTYPNSTGSGYVVSSNTRNEGMQSVRPLGIQGREDNVREQC
jgi:hypothetical protein